MSDTCYALVQGRLGGDPKEGETSAGKPKATFDLACNWRGAKAPATWFRVVCYGGVAERVLDTLRLAKGDMVNLVGGFASYRLPDQTVRSLDLVPRQVFLISRSRRKPPKGPAAKDDPLYGPEAQAADP